LITIEELKTITIKPGQVLVLRVSGRLSLKQREYLEATLRPVFNGAKLLILDSDTRLDVVEASGVSEPSTV
jgi:hypothetical protein